MIASRAYFWHHSHEKWSLVTKYSWTFYHSCLYSPRTSLHVQYTTNKHKVTYLGRLESIIGLFMCLHLISSIYYSIWFYVVIMQYEYYSQCIWDIHSFLMYNYTREMVALLWLCTRRWAVQTWSAQVSSY
jgi:hypothetical protein